MATKEVITKVWIEEGCIVCDACETASPDVFEVLEDSCIVRPGAMDAAFTQPRSESIVEAAEECPTDVIKFETVTVEVSDEEAASAPAAAEESTPEPTPAPAPVAAAAAHVEEKAPPVAAAAPAATVVAKAAVASTAGSADPAISALLRAATSRGGNVGILKAEENHPELVGALSGKNPRDLPPDARQAKVMEAARKRAKNPTRREAVGSGVVIVGWGAFSFGTAISVGPAFARFMMPNVLEEPDPRVRIGKMQKYRELAPGDVNEDYKPQGIWMTRDGDRLVALNIICTHLGCIPNWLPNDRKYKCPCHGSGYKPNGINFEGPTPRPLERFRLFIEDGIVVVDKSKKYQFELGQWDQIGSYIEM